MSDRGFTGVFLPASLYLDDSLSWIEKIFIVEVVALDAAEGCFASNKHFANHLQCSPSRASEIVASMADRGYVDIVQDKPESGPIQRFIVPTIQARELFLPPSRAEAAPLRKTEASPSENRSPPSENRSIIISNNNISLSRASVREDLTELTSKVVEAAGDALANPASTPGVAIMTPLLYLLADRPNAPACTLDEVLDGVTYAARYMHSRFGAGSMKNWELAAKKAIELRDLRINGQAVAPPKPSASSGPGDLLKITPEQWRGLVLLSNDSGGRWKPEWGPAPGAEGSCVPADLVGLWKGKVEA